MSTQNIVISVFLAVLTAGVFLAVNNYEEPPATVRRVDLSTDDLELLIQRSECFGPCPIYSMHVRGDGSLTDNQLFLIASELDRSDFLDYEAVEECIELATDHSSVALWVKWQGKERKVERYLGCKRAPPDPVPMLSRTIDEIVGTEQWIGNGASKWP